jgi:hypothetical protein
MTVGTTGVGEEIAQEEAVGVDATTGGISGGTMADVMTRTGGNETGLTALLAAETIESAQPAPRGADIAEIGAEAHRLPVAEAALRAGTNNLQDLLENRRMSARQGCRGNSCACSGAKSESARWD